MENTSSILDIVVNSFGRGLDLAGCIVIAGGAVIAFARSMFDKPTAGTDRYSLMRLRVGRAILLGLELMVAGDIIRTVAVDPTLQRLGVLAGIVIIRTFLSFSMELELNGRWPWQARSVEAAKP